MPEYKKFIPITDGGAGNPYTIDGFNITADSVSSAQSRAFDGSFSGNIANSFRSALNPSFPAHLTVTFPDKYTIGRYTIHLGYHHLQYANMETWDFEGLVNGQWIVLHSGEHSQVAESLTFDLEPVDVEGIRVKCKTRFGTNTWGVDELEVFEYATANKILIQSSSDYKFHDGVAWQSVGSAPTEQDYVDFGMDLSYIQTIPESAWQELDSPTISFYTDDVNKTEVLFTVETNPFTLYDEMGDSMNILYYTDNPDVAEPQQIEFDANYSPLDEIEGDFDLVTWTDEENSTRTLNLGALPNPQVAVLSSPAQLISDVEKISSEFTESTNSVNKTVVSFTGGTSWTYYDFDRGIWDAVNINIPQEVKQKGMNLSDLELIPNIGEKFGNKSMIMAFYLEEDVHTYDVSEIKSVSTNQFFADTTPKIDDMSLYILNTVSTINVEYSGGNLVGQIDDVDNGKVQYLIRLNGQIVYPTVDVEEFTELENSPLSISYTIPNHLINLDVNNTIEIEFKDAWGRSDFWNTSFIGTYYGLVFTDPDGGQYSTNVGEVLKYLKMGAITAGQVTQSYNVVMRNNHGYAVSDPHITSFVGHEGVTVELSKADSPFVGEPELKWDGTILQSGESVDFWVRLVTRIDSQPKVGGEFEIAVFANKYEEDTSGS